VLDKGQQQHFSPLAEQLHPCTTGRLVSIVLQNLPIMLLAFPKIFANYAHFYASQA